jgi:hypothetical protein
MDISLVYLSVGEYAVCLPKPFYMEALKSEGSE